MNFWKRLLYFLKCNKKKKFKLFLIVFFREKIFLKILKRERFDNNVIKIII